MTRDELEGRIWAEHQHDLATGFSAFAKDVLFTFDRLVAHLYEAPWRDAPPRKRCN